VHMTACTDTDGVVVAAQYGPRAGVVVVDGERLEAD
jgi:hypothetical protein